MLRLPPFFSSVAFLILASLWMSGCVSPLGGSKPEQRLLASGEWTIAPGLDVPRVRGVAGCGAQALAAVLAYHDPALDAADLAADLPWQDIGATPVDLLLAARDRGFTATIRKGTFEELTDAAAAGTPVLVMIDAAPEVRTLTAAIPTSRVMHWGVVSGVARDGSAVLIATRRGRHHVVAREMFLARWAVSANCAILVEPDQRRRRKPVTNPKPAIPADGR